MLKLCVAGAAGRMGVAIIQEARAKGIMTVGATEAPKAIPGTPTIGKTLRQLGISDTGYSNSKLRQFSGCT